MKIIEIKAYLEGRELPPKIEIEGIGLIFNSALFFQTHIETLEFNSGNKAFLPYYDRLMKAVNYLKSIENNNQP